MGLMAATVPGARANLSVFYSDVGPLRLSVDASGSNAGSEIVQVEKPAGATVERAFLFAASTGTSHFMPQDGEVAIDGTGVEWDGERTIPSAVNAVNVMADVTEMVKPKIDFTTFGRAVFDLTEAHPSEMDGEILVVVFNDPLVRTNTVTLLYGAQAKTGDSFAVSLGEPLKASAEVTMSLGISYGYQPGLNATGDQYSTVDVNGTRLTSSAGGQDDCPERFSGTPEWIECRNGTLITVGGLDDSTANPLDPNATAKTCLNEGVQAPRCDDELYDLRPFVPTGSTSIGVDTLNPSDDDNIFFAAFSLTASTAVTEGGIVLSPTGTRTQAELPHAFTALVQDASGQPAVGREVTLDVVSGPNAGTSLTTTTDIAGKVHFSYESSVAGMDTLEASAMDGSGKTRTSNSVTQTWIPRVGYTFGGGWPFAGESLSLYYAYDPGHYEANMARGAANWNETPTRLQIAKWPGPPYAVHLQAFDVDQPDEWWGLAIFPEDCSICGYTQNMIALNQRTLDPESGAQTNAVVTHELGHTIGLEHPYGIRSPVPSVMWQGYIEGLVRSKPQAFDTARVNAMYP